MSEFARILGVEDKVRKADDPAATPTQPTQPTKPASPVLAAAIQDYTDRCRKGEAAYAASIAKSSPGSPRGTPDPTIAARLAERIMQLSLLTHCWEMQTSPRHRVPAYLAMEGAGAEKATGAVTIAVDLAPFGVPGRLVARGSGPGGQVAVGEITPGMFLLGTPVSEAEGRQLEREAREARRAGQAGPEERTRQAGWAL